MTTTKDKLEFAHARKRKYEVCGIDHTFTSKREAFKQARNLARAAHCPVWVYELNTENEWQRLQEVVDHANNEG